MLDCWDERSEGGWPLCYEWEWTVDSGREDRWTVPVQLRSTVGGRLSERMYGPISPLPDRRTDSLLLLVTTDLHTIGLYHRTAQCPYTPTPVLSQGTTSTTTCHVGVACCPHCRYPLSCLQPSTHDCSVLCSILVWHYPLPAVLCCHSIVTTHSSSLLTRSLSSSSSLLPPSTVLDMSVKAAPRFGGGGEKCKTCDKTVYPNERISYDNGTWHQLCFKCTSCRSTLSLTAVAMINGTLYCKTCFKKIFMREGKYSTFESLPKDVAAQLTHAASIAATTSSDKQPVPVPARSASVSVTSSAGSAATTAPQTPLDKLQSAIERKDVAQCHTLLATYGASLLFEHVKSGATVLEWSLTSYMHKATGVKLVEWLETKMEETNRLLKQSGLSSPLEGNEQQLQQGKLAHVEEESKESTETVTEGVETETEPVDAAAEANEVEVTA